jgi:tetratricopeptide (TPR) repeat protein
VPEEWVAEVEALGPAAVPAMQKVLEEAPDSWGALRAAGVLEALAVSHPEACIPAIPALMKGLQEEGGDLVQERCMAALRRIGEPVLEEAARVLVKGDNTQKLYLMGVLEEIPVERSVDLLLKHYEELLEAWKEPTVEALKSLGSARAIEVLRPDALAGESLFEDALLLLCDLHGIQAKELAPLRARHAERTERLNRRLEALQSGLNLDALIAEDEKEEMRLELKCRECGRVYTYEVGKVTCCPDVDREGHKEQEFFFQRPIVCKNCGAEERYELAGHAYLMLTAELLKLTALAEEQGPGVSGTSRLQVVKNFGLVDGTRCTPHEAIDIYRQRIDREPRNPEHRFRFGNVLRFLGRTEEAQAQYEEAVRLDPTCLQAHFSLGTLAHEQGDRARMETHMKQVVALAPRSADPQRLDLALTARDLMAGRISKVEIGPAVVPPRGTPGPPPDASKRGQKKARRRQEQRQSRRAEPPARPAPPVPRFGKVGRNDPCPCGSGKKYKRCCGR